MYSDKWIEFRKSEDEYFARRYDFMQNEEVMINDLHSALSMPSDNETALRFLLDVTPDYSILIILISKIINIVVDSSSLTLISLAKKLLYEYRNEDSVKLCIEKEVFYYLAYEDDWHYRRIAELYKFLNYKEELIAFISICLESANEEINEVGRCFK